MSARGAGPTGAPRPAGHEADDALRARVAELVARQHALERGDSTPDPAVMRRLRAETDQAWDQVRQRDALRDAARDPAVARPRPIGEVEGYLQ